jgi:hypothetical protein
MIVGQEGRRPKWRGRLRLIDTVAGVARGEGRREGGGGRRRREGRKRGIGGWTARGVPLAMLGRVEMRREGEIDTSKGGSLFNLGARSLRTARHMYGSLLVYSMTLSSAPCPFTPPHPLSLPSPPCLQKEAESATTTCPLTVPETSRGPSGPAVPLTLMSVSFPFQTFHGFSVVYQIIISFVGPRAARRRAGGRKC